MIDLRQSGTALRATGLPSSASLEFRFQNTMNGKLSVHLIESDAQGNASISMPNDIGVHTSITIRVLDTSQKSIDCQVASDASPQALHFVSEFSAPLGGRTLMSFASLHPEINTSAQKSDALGGN